MFGKPEFCNDYKYLVKGVYGSKGANEGYNITRKNALPKENEKLKDLLRKASENAYEAVKEKYGD